MLRNNKGYLLVECMMGLILFTAVTSICLPFIYKLYQEKKTTKQLLYAIEEADLAAARYGLNKIQEPDKMWVHHGTQYSLLTKKGAADEYELCVEFKGANGKDYKTCAGYF